MSEEKPQEGVKMEKDHINLKVAGVQFKIKRHALLCKRIRFRFDGQPINEREAPAQLEMDDEDTNINLQWLSRCPSVWTRSCLTAPGCLFGSPGQDGHHPLLLA
uniref:Rad60/SUMO-like domain-containing protein n=1 Tax=Capra hircus TaxID=9925 RepID=A0A452EA27_CAPHI